jgi:hypothetical protein
MVWFCGAIEALCQPFRAPPAMSSKRLYSSVSTTSTSSMSTICVQALGTSTDRMRSSTHSPMRVASGYGNMSFLPHRRHVTHGQASSDGITCTDWSGSGQCKPLSQGGDPHGGELSYVAARVCHPSAQSGIRHPDRPGMTRAQRRQYDDDRHPRAQSRWSRGHESSGAARDKRLTAACRA